MWLWRREKRRFPYDRTPDDRAVLFLEYVEEHADEIEAERLEQYEVPDEQWAELAEQYYREQGVTEHAAVPF